MLDFPSTVYAAETSPERHVLNRLTWGARPQDVATVQQMGVEAYINWQLNPETIDDPLADAFAASRPILAMPVDELRRVASENYDFVLRTALWTRIFRAVYSEHQLYERMVEFWTDHLNIPIGDLVVEKLIDDHEVIRKHALGSFRNLLFASAQSPAMLYYLNNADSNKDHPNENYARELMELHSLGVEGGYTEVDVVEVARAFTGWTVSDAGEFYFDLERHDSDEKLVLGHSLPAGRGIEDGLQVLDILVRHPSTAQFISKKLARRFISDNPPQSVIDSTAAVFSATSGDIREVMRHLLLSPEFMASAGQKFRRPMDAVVAMMRALTPGLAVDNPDPIAYTMEAMGQMPYFWHPPNGYPDAAGAWINTNGILQRWNTAMQLALAGDGYFEGIVLNLDLVISSANTVGELVDSAVERILGSAISPEDRDQLIAYVSRSGDPTQALTDDLRRTKLPGLVGILMASPYFQWI
ncbi:MAG: DUF1800 domain-containing protein [Chloroflexota bacterium]